MAGKRKASGADSAPPSSKKPKQARGKGKKVEEPTETAPTTGVIVEDTINQALETAFLGTVLLDVRCLSIQWENQKRNRELQPSLVARLKDAFKNGIKRYAIEDHLKATTTNASFERLLEINFPLSEQKRDSELAYLRSRAATHSGLKSTMLHVKTVSPATPLTLRNGQHRVQALVELCDEQKQLAASGAFDDSGNPIGPPGDDDYLWAVDLYDSSQLKPDTLNALISNCDVVRKTNSEGYNALNIITYIEQLDDEERAERLKASNFKQWLNNVFGVNLTYTTRMITILKDKTLSKMIRLYCGTRYGENSFNWSLMARIQAGKQTEMWKQEFQKFFKFCSTIFGAKHQNLIVYNDWKMILALDQGRPLSQLRLLFFPKREDYWTEFTNGSVQRRKQPFPISSDYSSKLELPKLESPIVIQNQEFANRRPGFLVNLSDASYKDVFRHLHAHQNLYCPTWNNWVDLEKNVSSVVSKVLHHVMMWIEPTWRLPSKSSHEWMSFSWLHQIEQFLFLDEDDSAPSSETPEHKAWEFLQNLWELVRNENLWQDPNLQTFLNVPESTLGDNLEIDEENTPKKGQKMRNAEESRQQYLRRFQYVHWIQVVKLVIDARPDCLQGIMSEFNDINRLTAAYEPYTPWGDIFCKMNFSQNKMLQKTPCLNSMVIRSDIALQGDILGAIVHYRHLKQQMILTCEWGWKKPARKNPARPLVLIASPAEYETAVEVLQELAMLLAKFGYETDIDNWNEDLQSFTINRSNRTEPLQDRPAKKGFLTARPPKYVNLEDEARAMVKALQTSIVKNRLERPLPAKTLRLLKKSLSNVDLITSVEEQPVEKILRSDGTLLDGDDYVEFRSLIRKLHVKLQEILDAEDTDQLKNWRLEYRKVHSDFDVACSDELSGKILDDYSDLDEDGDGEDGDGEDGDGEDGDGEDGDGEDGDGEDGDGEDGDGEDGDGEDGDGKGGDSKDGDGEGGDQFSLTPR